MQFSEKLILLRKAKGMSQEELAEKLGVSRQAVSRWEQGSSFPDLPNLQRLVTVFEVSADYLIGDGPQDRAFKPETSANIPDTAPERFDFKRNRFLIIGFMWLFAALCFLAAAIDNLNISFVGIAFADILLACLNLFLHFRKQK